MVFHGNSWQDKNGAKEDLEVHVNLETDVQGVFPSWRYPMVQLSGGGPLGDRIYLKKIKLGLPKLEG
jgi:hypothetical protein